MNPVEKFIIRDKLKEKFPEATEELLYNLISELDKMKVLHSFREPKQDSLNTSSEVNSALPKTFKMVSPLWSGYVRLKDNGIVLGYEDENGNIRLHGTSEKDLIKKVKKYRRD